jgi:hypothetical protein
MTAKELLEIARRIVLKRRRNGTVKIRTEHSADQSLRAPETSQSETKNNERNQ